MRRDMDLIRKLMLFFEEYHFEPGDFVILEAADPELAVFEKTEAEMEYHLDLLRQTGMLNCPREGQPMLGIGFKGLTWAGHDFVDALRGEEIWSKTKSTAEKAGGWTVGLLVDIAKAYLKAEIGKHLPGF